MLEQLEKQLNAVNTGMELNAVMKLINDVDGRVKNSSRFKAILEAASAKAVIVKPKKGIPSVITLETLDHLGELIETKPEDGKYLWFINSPVSRISYARVFNVDTFDWESRPVLSHIWKLYLKGLSFSTKQIRRKKGAMNRVRRFFSFNPEEIVFTETRRQRVVKHLALVYEAQEEVLTGLDKVDYQYLAENELARTAVPFGYRPVGLFGFRTVFNAAKTQVCFSTVAGLVFAKISSVCEDDRDFGRLIVRFTGDHVIWSGNGIDKDPNGNSDAFRLLIDSVLVQFLRQRQDAMDKDEGFHFVPLVRSVNKSQDNSNKPC